MELLKFEFTVIQRLLHRMNLFSWVAAQTLQFIGEVRQSHVIVNFKHMWVLRNPFEAEALCYIVYCVGCSTEADTVVLYGKLYWRLTFTKCNLILLYWSLLIMSARPWISYNGNVWFVQSVNMYWQTWCWQQWTQCVCTWLGYVDCEFTCFSLLFH